MNAKVKYVRSTKARVIFDNQTVELLESMLWAGGDDRHYEFQPTTCKDFDSFNQLVNTYARASALILMEISTDMAGIQNQLATRDALVMKLLGVTMSAVYALGLWYLKDNDDVEK